MDIMTKTRKQGWIVLAFLIILAALIWIESKAHPFGKWISSTVYDNRVHYSSCEELPSLSNVEQVMEDHHDVIQQIENIDPGFIRVYIDSSCPGKGSLVIEYPSHGDRVQIEALIGETFFGIPWKGVNI
jgi:hypothetical protein